jgi:uncharacterized protein
MLNSLVDRVNGTKLTEKDPDAAALLARGLSSNPDATYILAQSVLVQNIALEQARAQLTQAQEQLKQAQQHTGHTSFLGSLLGHRDPAPQSQPVQSAPVQNIPGQAVQPAYQPVYSPQAPPVYEAPYPPPPPYGGPYAAPPYGGPAYGPPGYGPPMGQPSFLRSAAQTAAGVAAGALAFEGVEALLHGGFGHPGMGMGMGGWGMPGVGFGMGPGMGVGGMGMGGMGMGYERPIEETVVNNYYDSPGGGYEHEHGGGERFHESVSEGGGHLSDASWDNDNGSAGQNDNYDSGSSYDDSSNFGNDGGFDGGGDDAGLL